MEFARPWLLSLLLLVIPIAWLRLKKGGEPAVLRHPNLALMQNIAPSLKVVLHRYLPWLSIMAMVLLVAASAGPRIPHIQEDIEGEGIDIILALDISGSMQALDFEPLNRLEAAKNVISEFIEGRSNDRIGLVVFAAKAFTQCPLTLDHPVLNSFLDGVQIGLIADGTAIGLGLATAVNRLKDSTSPSRTVILLTDGENNVPTLEPETAANVAEALGVRVYTIAIGREGLVPFPVDNPFFGKQIRQIETDIDLELLQKIADMTDGKMFQATDPEALKNIFDDIDTLETARYTTTVSTWYSDKTYLLGIPAFVLLLLEGLLSATWLRRLP
jgi:Ca-activated chloride channel homolog